MDKQQRDQRKPPKQDAKRVKSVVRTYLLLLSELTGYGS